MPIIRSSRLYLRYCRIWCVMPCLLVVGCWEQSSRLCVRDEGNCSSSFPQPGHIACCPAPNSRPPATKALHTICGNNASIVSSSWWWAYKCPKHVEQIISAIKHSVASSWFSSLRLKIRFSRCGRTICVNQGSRRIVWQRRLGLYYFHFQTFEPQCLQFQKIITWTWQLLRDVIIFSVYIFTWYYRFIHYFRTK